MAVIIINPEVFGDKRDGLAVAYNEAFRVLMEENGFEPVSEPTEAQRRFFADTAYADDEVMLRRTILARIATFDTSVEDPTDEQLQETQQFLQGLLDSNVPQNDAEQENIEKIIGLLGRVIESSSQRDEGTNVAEEELAPEEKPVTEEVRGDIKGGNSWIAIDSDNVTSIGEPVLELPEPDTMPTLRDVPKNEKKQTEYFDELKKKYGERWFAEKYLPVVLGVNTRGTRLASVGDRYYSPNKFAVKW